MTESEQVDQLHTALATAQGAMENATFNRVNPHFKNKYADLAAVWDAIREPLSKNGLSVTQTIGPYGEGTYLFTTLRHKSGQWIRSLFPLPQSSRPQEFGSALTYARRYSLSAIIGIAADEDDDANAAQANGKRENPNVNKPNDFVDKAEYVDGDIDQPINNIPRGNPELKKLGKKDADVLINNLRVKMKYATNRVALKAWGESVRDEVETLPDQHKVQIREDYADRMNELP